MDWRATIGHFNQVRRGKENKDVLEDLAIFVSQGVIIGTVKNDDAKETGIIVTCGDKTIVVAAAHIQAIAPYALAKAHLRSEQRIT